MARKVRLPLTDVWRQQLFPQARALLATQPNDDHSTRLLGDAVTRALSRGVGESADPAPSADDPTIPAGTAANSTEPLVDSASRRAATRAEPIRRQHPFGLAIRDEVLPDYADRV